MDSVAERPRGEKTWISELHAVAGRSPGEMAMWASSSNAHASQSFQHENMAIEGDLCAWDSIPFAEEKKKGKTARGCQQQG